MDATRYILSLPNNEYLHEDVIRLLKEAFVAGKLSSWVKESDRKPDDDELKLVWFAKATHFPDLSYGGCELAWWDGKHWGDTKHDNIENNADYMLVTHWTNLPEQPKNNER